MNIAKFTSMIYFQQFKKVRDRNLLRRATQNLVLVQNGGLNSPRSNRNLRGIAALSREKETCCVSRNVKVK